MVYGLLRALLGDRLFCHRRSCGLPRENLTPASGRRDHTTSPSAGEPRSSVVAPASIASDRNVRDDRDPPLIRRETRGFKSVIRPTAKAKYSCARDRSDFLVICPTAQLAACEFAFRHCEPTGRANARPMTGSAKQSIAQLGGAWIASSLSLLAMTATS